MKDEEKEVRTFDCTSGGVAYCYGCYTMTEDKDGYGDWVRKEDYDAICARYAEQIAELERMLEHEANEKAKYKDMLKTSSTQRERQLEREVAMLMQTLKAMAEHFKDVPSVEQVAYDEPPEPASQWDYDAFVLLGDARICISETQSTAEQYEARVKAKALEETVAYMKQNNKVAPSAYVTADQVFGEMLDYANTLRRRE